MTEMRNDDDQSQTIYINIYFRKFEFELCMYEYSPLVSNTEMLIKNPADNGELQKKKDIPQRQPRGTCHVLCFAPTPRLVLSEPLCETQPETTFRCHTIGHAKQPSWKMLPR
jgi:hypothetical protein